MASFTFDANEVALLDKFEFGFSVDGDIASENVQLIKATLEDYVATEKIEKRDKEPDAVLAAGVLGKL